MSLSTAAPSHRNSGRALVIDDELSIRRVLRRYLEREGWSVVEAADGASARGALDAVEQFDLVICDLNLPDCTGLDLRRDVTERVPAMGDRFVVATGESPTGGGTLTGRDAHALSESGLLLTKPFSLDELGEVVGGRGVRGEGR